MSASIENDFDVMIPVAGFGNYKTIGALADFVMEEMGYCVNVPRG